jgi:hypothetical protein
MSRVRGAVAATQRCWWLVALLVLLVAAGSLVQYVGPEAVQRDTYIATRSLRIVVVPSEASTTYDGYVAARQEDEIARMLTTGGLLGSARLSADIARQMRISPRVTRLGALNISATHSGNLVTLTIRGRSPYEANTRATAAVETLDSTMVSSLLPSTLRPTSSETLLVQAEGSASQPVRDATQDAAAVWQIVARIALAFVAGVLLALLLGWWMSRSQARRLA